MMTEAEMHATFRELTGQPPESVVSYRTINTHLKNGVSTIAVEIGIPKRTDTTGFPLETGIHTYAIPSDILDFQEILWNDLPLKFTSIEEWRRYNVNWRTPTPSNPQEVAVDGRELIVYPRPSASAIATAGSLTIRAKLATFQITPAGVPGFSDTDVLLAVYAGAREFMSFKNVDGRYDRLLQSINGLMAPMLVSAKQRYAHMIEDYNAGMSVVTGRVAPGR